MKKDLFLSNNVLLYSSDWVIHSLYSPSCSFLLERMGVSQMLEQSRKGSSLAEERNSVKCFKRLIRVLACFV